LGVLNLDVQNKCLLSKWLFKLLNEDGVWQPLLRNKYLKKQDPNIGSTYAWGFSILCWVIWLTRNDIVFDKVLAPSYLQVIFKGTYWIRFWSLLQKEEDRQMMKMGCRKIETTAMEVFARNGWRFSNRITF